MNKNKRVLSIIVNLFLFVSTLIIAIINIFITSSEGQAGENMTGLGFFKAFTNLSNCLMGITGLITAIYQIKNKTIPKWLERMYLASACGVGLTFLTVLVFLGPLFVSFGYNYFIMFAGMLFFLHFLNPVLGCLMFALIITERKINKLEILFGCIPTFIYSIIYLFAVAVFKVWSDFYGFTFGGHFELIPIVLVIMYGVTYLIGLSISSIHNKLVKEI